MTDHRALEHLTLEKKTFSTRMIRHSFRLNRFITHREHRPGSTYTVADYLSAELSSEGETDAKKKEIRCPFLT